MSEINFKHFMTKPDVRTLAAAWPLLVVLLIAGSVYVWTLQRTVVGI